MLATSQADGGASDCPTQWARAAGDGDIELCAGSGTFQLPTAYRALFEKGGEEKFFVGTTVKPWTTGTFGCVRSGGWQMHEGLDIHSVQRDKRGEPLDPVMATADGSVAYINTHPSLSNYPIQRIRKRHEPSVPVGNGR